MFYGLIHPPLRYLINELSSHSFGTEYISFSDGHLGYLYSSVYESSLFYQTFYPFFQLIHPVKCIHRLYIVGTMYVQHADNMTAPPGGVLCDRASPSPNDTRFTCLVSPALAMNSAKGAPRKSVAFISGPINTGSDGHYFHTHYAPKITEAIKHGDDFVIGPIPSGVDAEALDYLLAYPVAPTRITIFVTPAEEVMWGAHFRARGVHLHVVDGQMSRERDAALTSASDYDILRLRTDDEAQAFYGQVWRAGYVTNTERNWKRRHGIAEDVTITAEEINRAVGIAPETPFQPGGWRKWVARSLNRRR